MTPLNDCLFIIPARAGSKGVPGKNVRFLRDKPLIQYSIEYALYFTKPGNVCVSTNDLTVVAIAENLAVKVPFIRPEELSNDTASADQVIRHTLSFFKNNGIDFETVIYLQPTSPFRLHKHLEEAYNVYVQTQADMVVSVCESPLNPYFSLFEEDASGNLRRSKELPTGISRRQDTPKTYLYNGSIYIINSKKLENTPLHELKKVKKYVMDPEYAIDIDTEKDWMYAEFLQKNKLIKVD